MHAVAALLCMVLVAGCGKTERQLRRAVESNKENVGVYAQAAGKGAASCVNNLCSALACMGSRHIPVLLLLQEAAEEHDSCTNNLYNALKDLGLSLTNDPRNDYYTPAPFNLWMNVAPEPDHTG